MMKKAKKTSRTNIFLLNTASTGVLQIITMLVGLIVPRLMLKYYGSEINGLVSSILQLITYSRLIEAGLSNAAVYALYKPLADGNKEEISSIVSASKTFYLQAGYIFTIIVAALAVIYPLIIKTQVLSKPLIGLLVLVLGINGILEFFTLAKYRVLLTADQKTYVISLTSILQIVVNTIVIVVLSIKQVNIVLLKFVATFSILLRTVILIFYSRKTYPSVDYKAPPNKKALNKRWDALYLQILGAIQTGAPVLILTFIVNDLKIVSVYTIYYMVIGGLNAVLSIFIAGLPASFGEIIAKKEEGTLQKAYSQFEFVYYLLISIIYSVSFIMIMSFISIYTKGITDTNYNIPILGVLFVLNGLLYNLKTPQGMLVMSAGLYKETRWQTTIQGAIMLFGGIALAIPWGIHGVLIASIISNAYRCIDLLIYIPKKVTNLPVYKSFFKWLIVALSVALSQIPFFFVKLEPNNFGEWTLYALGVLAFVFIVVNIVFLIFDFNTYKEIVKRFTKRRSKQ